MHFKISGIKPCKCVLEYSKKYKSCQLWTCGFVACTDNLYVSAIQFTLSFASYHLINKLL